MSTTLPPHPDSTSEQLEGDINAWVEESIEAGENVPDFWDEHSTSERLAEYLERKGWTKP